MLPKTISFGVYRIMGTHPKLVKRGKITGYTCQIFGHNREEHNSKVVIHHPTDLSKRLTVISPRLVLSNEAVASHDWLLRF